MKIIVKKLFGRKRKYIKIKILSTNLTNQYTMNKLLQ